MVMVSASNEAKSLIEIRKVQLVDPLLSSL